MNFAFIDIAKNLEFMNESMQIYRDSFPDWEREDEESILKNIKNGRYKMFSYICNSEILGFYILDINNELDYMMLSFLAVKSTYRGEGVGTKLALHAIDSFHQDFQINWLLIEAQERQEKLYKKLGFKTIELDYRAPQFNCSQSVKMNLMLIKKSKELKSDSLKNIIRDIFHRGYSLNRDDARIEEQIARINWCSKYSYFTCPLCCELFLFW